jgi:hypothetical protein
MNATGGKRVWPRRLSVFGGAIAVLAAVAACASPGSTSPGGSGSASPGGQQSAMPPVASCGRAVTHGLNSDTQMLSSDKGALTCFQKAAKTCTAASLGVTVMGVDTGTSDVLAIDPAGTSGSRCQVTWWHQAYSANNGGSAGKVGSTPCQLGTVTSAGVTLSCAGRTLLIPAVVAAR